MEHQERRHDRDSDDGSGSRRHFREHRITSVGVMFDERKQAGKSNHLRGGRQG
jgi:hypothetical protein